VLRYIEKTCVPKRLLTLILKALLNPEAKKPPKGPIMELNRLREIECQIKG